jgi:hypothetical protein
MIEEWHRHLDSVEIFPRARTIAWSFALAKRFNLCAMLAQKHAWYAERA